MTTSDLFYNVLILLMPFGFAAALILWSLGEAQAARERIEEYRRIAREEARIQAESRRRGES